MIQFSKGGKPKSIDEIVTEIAKEFAVDASLVKAIITAESNCNPLAQSPKGAQGLMQLMPATAKGLKVDKPFDPRENIIGGVKYIKGLMASYGDLRLALAAYNAGPGAVQKYAGIPPYRETINYVEKVIRHYNKFRRDPTLKSSGRLTCTGANEKAPSKLSHIRQTRPCAAYCHSPLFSGEISFRSCRDHLLGGVSHRLL